MKNKLVKIVYRDNGTADLYIDSMLSNDAKYEWIERNYVDRPFYTGWDITDSGFMLNFDLSLDANRSCFKTDSEYIKYIKQAIKENCSGFTWAVAQ